MKSKLLKCVFFICISFAISCGGGGGSDKIEPVQPAKAILISPAKDEPCNQGSVLDNSTLSTVTFNWKASEDTDSYTLILKNLEDNTTTQNNSTSNSLELNIKRGINYSWFVISKSSESTLTNDSETWNFYNAAEGTVNHIPYPATLVNPTMNATSASKNVTLQWTTSDLDSDISGYDVYIGTAENNLTKQNTVNTNQLSLSLEADTFYYWRVYTKDAVGNISISSVFEFKTGV
ncbi:fibronectin type III domain-containing protein [Wenyingzhuangia sp. 2_MG-2023]|uniref:fibronectin type III domain-containing protein n=1 Tax=Wenyingzhuangia sp. 2_MG-2023 TaxID=3062639 RepID=UPI0026E1F256|nr:hypothetical protein [Wenyingzhuangia sp. 2_MG-2023]MDO6738569.1 hypothetical protein [Wenyingzhuangia sp. 2_MG-2023]